jgi:hypothetical protein
LHHLVLPRRLVELLLELPQPLGLEVLLPRRLPRELRHLHVFRVDDALRLGLLEVPAEGRCREDRAPRAARLEGEALGFGSVDEGT